MRKVAIVLFAFCSALCLGLYAAEPPSAPILSLETGTHTAMINRAGIDAAERMVVTASDDKTLRVWELPSGRLLRVIRPPLGPGNEGKLFAVALSSDGRLIACGGWTQFNDGKLSHSDEGDSIYLFDAASGAFLRRIAGLPDVIDHLAFSPNSRLLAATMGSDGMKLFRASDGSELGSDSDYAKDSMYAAFSPDGRCLATTCFDSYIRLYDISDGKLRLMAKTKANGAEQPFSLAYSPDSTVIAVGYNDTSGIDLLSAKDLSLLKSPDISGGNEEGQYSSVAFSKDGKYLFAGGLGYRKINGSWEKLVRRWDKAGLGDYTDIITGAGDVIMDVRGYGSSGALFVTGDPAMGLIAGDGRVTLLAKPSIPDYRSNIANFLLSDDGASVEFSYLSSGKAPAFFSIGGGLSMTQPSQALAPPTTTSTGIKVTDWEDSYTPKLNGQVIKISQYEYSRCYAIQPNGGGFVLGADWRLRFYSPDGTLRWERATPGTTWDVNISGDGRVIAAAYADGTIRWHRVSDGEELLALFPHPDQRRWVLWTPSGYYDCSPGGEDLIGWRVNNGMDAASDFFPASRFRAKYRPDVVAKVLQTLDETEALGLADAEAGRKASTSTPLGLPPVVTILSPSDGSSLSAGEVTIRFVLKTPADAPVTGLRVSVDGRPVETKRGLAVELKEGEQSVTVAVPAKDCELGLIAENRNAASVPSTVRLKWVGVAPNQADFIAKPKLYVLAVGISAYKDTSLRLGLAAKDAKDFAAAMRKQTGGLYREVVVKELEDEAATKDDILDGLDWLRTEATARDVAMLFMAGHGVNDQVGAYYFLPQNADTNRLMRSGVAFSDIKNTLASIAGKAVFFVDTCHSGNIMGTRRGVADITAVVNELSAAENGAVVFASSTGRQYSLEDPAWGNGAFTKALIEGLSGKADYTGSGKITTNMLDLYVSERVKQLTGGRQTPTTTKPETVPDFPIAVAR